MLALNQLGITRTIELAIAETELRASRGFWERAAAAVGMEHPPRRIDPSPIPPEREYQRNWKPKFDDGWREFTEEDVLNYLRSIGRSADLRPRRVK